MMYGLHVVGYLGIAILVSAVTSPTIFGEDLKSNFLAQSNEDIVRLVLGNSVENETNYIFSPFGYSTILAILAEGASGETRDELRKILHSPADADEIRESFRNTLRRLQEKGAANVPEFRTYFYVYKNFTVDDEYKAILLENYFTEVRSVEKPSYENTAESTSIASNRRADAADQNASAPKRTAPAAIAASNSRPANTNNATTTLHERVKRLARRFLGIELEDTPSVATARQIPSVSVDDWWRQADDESEILSKLIVFNGLYFDGAWKTPFQYKLGPEPFYKRNNEKITTRMMYAVGQFKVGQIPQLESTAICLPYKGERYSFVIVYPDAVNGTRKLINDLKNVQLSRIHSTLESRHVQISIPSFEFNSVSYLKESLKSIGVEKIFAHEAEFDGFGKQHKGLFVDDVVQLVTIKANNESAAPNFLTASSVQTRTVTEKFTVDRPFVFLIQDHKDDLIVAAGKLYTPTE